MKESGNDILYIGECVSRTPDDFTVLAGSASTLFQSLCAGVDGAVRGRLAVVVLGQLHVLSLSPFADQTLTTPHPGQIIAHPALDPAGHLIVAEVSDSTALSNLWLWTVP